MKLRIRGNSVRLRLMRAEVSALLSEGRVCEQVDFPDRPLRYVLVRDAHAVQASAGFDGADITVRLPAAQVDHWAGSETEVSIEAQQAGASGDVRILVEKDFACLQPRRGEDERDMFAHPKEGQLKC